MGFFGIRWPLRRINNREPFTRRKIKRTRTELPIRPQLNQGCTISLFRHQKPVKLFLFILWGE
ncbi:MAG: hypothetical protein CVV13_07435 [Gammaproteobacteria bacterium HGW-Gammaproteobacteria-3]|nr:MAG: hypothetical protein CVV13_07435 [Gammaproteobacteria bacterium HGW-Gammaproteobacteria-3]